MVPPAFRALTPIRAALTPPLGPAYPSSAALSPDGRLALVVGGERIDDVAEVRVWEVEPQTPSNANETFQAESPNGLIDLSPDGRRFAYRPDWRAYKGTMSLQDTQTGRPYGSTTPGLNPTSRNADS